MIAVGQATLGAVSHRAWAIDVHARQLARAADHSPCQDLRERQPASSQDRRCRRDDVDHGRLEHEGDGARIERRGPQSDGRAHRAAPEHRLERNSRGRLVPAGAASSSSQTWISRSLEAAEGRKIALTLAVAPRIERRDIPAEAVQSAARAASSARDVSANPCSKRTVRPVADVPAPGNQRATRRDPSPALADDRPPHRPGARRHPEKPGALSATDRYGITSAQAPISITARNRQANAPKMKPASPTSSFGPTPNEARRRCRRIALAD